MARKVEAAFERAGVRRTPQRFFVLEHLMTHPDHATVEELWAALNRRHARASRATVYNTLHALVEAGLVREFTLDGKAARYDANLDQHHHFVCDKCGAVEDVDWFEIPALSRARSSLRRIRSYEVILRGECARCH
ncbi:MAG TPA: Fur family transcriptional regulator [Bryobacteraceae bacterium]|nr:Fur family transcriptional regulator [Bryobacteraceae bacterium]